MKKHEHSGCKRKTLENPEQILLSAGLERGGVLLDIGTGSGYLAMSAAEIMGKGSKVYAIDTDEGSIDALNAELSEKGISNVIAMRSDAVKAIPLQRGSVDWCLMSNVLHGFAANNEIDAVMKNINTVLAEEGKLIIVDFKKMDTGFGPPLEIRLSPEETETALKPYGYELVKQFDAGASHYCLVFKRICLQEKWC